MNTGCWKWLGTLVGGVENAEDFVAFGVASFDVFVADCNWGRHVLDPTRDVNGGHDVESSLVVFVMVGFDIS